MSYYHLPTATERSPGRLETKLSDGRQLGPPETGWTDELAQLCGFVQVVTTTRPDDTSTLTSDRTLTLPSGVPTETWTVRAKTATELDSDKSGVNRGALEADARAAYNANRAYLAIATPNNAQVVAQVRRLTRTVQGLIRLGVAPDLLADDVID